MGKEWLLCILIYHHIFPFHFFFFSNVGLILGSFPCFQVMKHIHEIKYFCFELFCFCFWDFWNLILNFPVSCWKIFTISVNCLASLGRSILFTVEILLLCCPYFNFPLKLSSLFIVEQTNFIVFGWQLIMYSTFSVFVSLGWDKCY